MLGLGQGVCNPPRFARNHIARSTQKNRSVAQGKVCSIGCYIVRIVVFVLTDYTAAAFVARHAKIPPGRQHCSCSRTVSLVVAQKTSRRWTHCKHIPHPHSLWAVPVGYLEPSRPALPTDRLTHSWECCGGCPPRSYVCLVRSCLVLGGPLCPPPNSTRLQQQLGAIFSISLREGLAPLRRPVSL